MFFVGIDCYGFGVWVQIRDDFEFDMKDKFFLEEYCVGKKEEWSKGNDKMKVFGVVYLVCCFEYLFFVLEVKYFGVLR